MHSGLFAFGDFFQRLARVVLLLRASGVADNGPLCHSMDKASQLRLGRLFYAPWEILLIDCFGMNVSQVNVSQVNVLFMRLLCTF